MQFMTYTNYFFILFINQYEYIGNEVKPLEYRRGNEQAVYRHLFILEIGGAFKQEC